MSYRACCAMSLITATLLTAACWLGGCDGSQKTSPSQDASDQPIAVDSSQTSLGRQSVGHWIINISEYSSFFEKYGRSGDSTAISHRTTTERSFVTKYPLAVDKQEHALQIYQIDRSGDLDARKDEPIQLDRVFPPPKKPIADEVVGQWTIDTAATESHINRCIDTFGVFYDSECDWRLYEVLDILRSQRLPNPLIIEADGKQVRMRVGDQTGKWPYQISDRFVMIQLGNDNLPQHRESDANARLRHESEATRLNSRPAIVVGQDQLCIIADDFTMFREFIALPASKHGMVTSIFFKRETSSICK